MTPALGHPFHKEIHAMRLVSLCTALGLGLSGLAIALPPAEAQDAKKVEEGKPAPDIKLPATNVGKALPDKKDAKELSLKDVKGKNIVLFFFPKAMTRG
jgi:hypothetical protein